jgi:GMP synthase (glutamine-hydrolysing)
MLIFVDYEHASGHDADYGERLLAARTWITYRLEDLSGLPCHLVRYDRIGAELLDALDATAIFISGNGADPSAYTPEDVKPIHDILRTTELPVFGFCGGLQLLSEALGATVEPIAVAADTMNEPTLITMGDGSPFEFGYHPIVLDDGADAHPLLDGLGNAPVFRHAHGLQVMEPPTGFDNLASTPVTPVQMIVNDDRRMVGTQFHPEYWTDEHPDGRALIANFLRWANIGNDR